MQPRRKTKRPFFLFLAIVFGVLGGGAVWLATLEVPVQQERIEKTLPPAQFLKKGDA